MMKSSENRLRSGFGEGQQVGHSKLLKDYLHIRRQALDSASAALEPTFMNRTTADLREAELVN